MNHPAQGQENSQGPHYALGRADDEWYAERNAAFCHPPPLPQEEGPGDNVGPL